MVEKIIFDKDLIEKTVNRTDISILFIKYNIESKMAYYRTDISKIYRPILFEKVINI